MTTFKFTTLILLALFLNSCTSGESKLQGMITREIGKKQLIEKARLEMDKVLGKRDSRLKQSALEFIDSRMEISFPDTLIDGRRARVQVKAVLPRVEEVSAALFAINSMPKEKMLELSFEEFLEELSRSGRRPAGVVEIKDDVYEFSIDFDRDRDWSVNPDQLRRAYSKRNLVVKK